MGPISINQQHILGHVALGSTVFIASQDGSGSIDFEEFVAFLDNGGYFMGVEGDLLQNHRKTIGKW